MDGEGIPVSPGESAESLFGGLSAPDYTDWVIGWKAVSIMRLDSRTAIALSLAGACPPIPWQKGENKAVHWSPSRPREDLACPCDDGHCGFNAFFEIDDAIAYRSCNVAIRGRGRRFAVHPDGFRAEYAEILCFVGLISEKLAAQYYGVPCFTHHNQAEKYLRDHPELGAPFPKDRRPASYAEIMAAEEAETEVKEDWKEEDIGNLTNVLTHFYMIFMVVITAAFLCGFLFAAIRGV